MSKIGCMNEYAPLKKVLVCEPQFLMKPQSMPVSIDIAIKEHHHFVSTLKDYGVDVVSLPPAKQFPEQVFTRDTGFVLGEELFIANIQNYIRQGEEEYLREQLEQVSLPYQTIPQGKIEGGDVIIDGDTVYVGISNRTNQEAAKQLQGLLPNFNVVEVPFSDAYLHLDCVINILSPEEGIIYPEEIHGEKIKLLKKRYDLISVSKEEQATLATNVLSLGDKKVISLPINKELNKELRLRGYEVIEVDFTEMIKFGGAFRCCTLPILRK
ncbi:arginine deiminase family protein [Robertmurraya massiliosenegalensis]|uniref:dimethylarginine dimethylaminohydrolase family protein n=1 Tax=Robertmurraya TaxID=2837507 RepID=UPI0039A65B1C